MIAEIRFGAESLEPVLRGRPADAAAIVSLDAAEEVPLSAGLWLADGDAADAPDAPDAPDALEDRDPVRRVSPVPEVDRGAMYRVSYDSSFRGADVYHVAVDSGGLFTAGRAGRDTWTVRMRFPDEDAVAAVRDRCSARGLEASIDTVEDGVGPYADRFGLTSAQRRALLTAADSGYFEVPRDTSLAGLAEELDISSQAASERVRRGLDSLVTGTLRPARRD